MRSGVGLVRVRLHIFPDAQHEKIYMYWENRRKAQTGEKEEAQRGKSLRFWWWNMWKGYRLWNFEMKKSVKMVRKRRNIAITGM